MRNCTLKIWFTERWTYLLAPKCSIHLHICRNKLWPIWKKIYCISTSSSKKPNWLVLKKKNPKNKKLWLPVLKSEPVICWSQWLLLLLLLSCVWHFCDPMDISLPGSSIHDISAARILSCHFLLQGIFPSQGSNPCLLHCRGIL